MLQPGAVHESVISLALSPIIRFFFVLRILDLSWLHVYMSISWWSAAFVFVFVRRKGEREVWEREKVMGERVYGRSDWIVYSGAWCILIFPYATHKSYECRVELICLFPLCCIYRNLLNEGNLPFSLKYIIPFHLQIAYWIIRVMSNSVALFVYFWILAGISECGCLKNTAVLEKGISILLFSLKGPLIFLWTPNISLHPFLYPNSIFNGNLVRLLMIRTEVDSLEGESSTENEDREEICRNGRSPRLGLLIRELLPVPSSPVLTPPAPVYASAPLSAEDMPRLSVSLWMTWRLFWRCVCLR